MKKTVYFIISLIFVFLSGFLSRQYFNPHDFIEHLKHQPEVSVVMSTFNREHALPTAIESILQQTFKDFEFIIIDDGSTDRTWKIIQNYAKKDSRIKPLKNEINQGLIYSLNRGLDKARGKYIARMDDDDKSVSYRLERQVWAMNENPDIVVLGGDIYRSDIEPGKPLTPPRLSSPDEIALSTYFTSGVVHPTVMMRRDFLNKHHLRYNPKYLYAEDSGLWKDILNKGGKITKINEKLLYFGYVKNVERPPSYHRIQNESYKQIQLEKIKPFWEDVPYNWLSMYVSTEHKCLIYQKMIESNEKLKILNQTVLKKAYDFSCVKNKILKDDIFVSHPNWTDWIRFKDKKNFYRVDIPEETGKIIREDNETVTIKWDHYGTEVFIKENDGNQLKYQKGIQ